MGQSILQFKVYHLEPFLRHKNKILLQMKLYFLNKVRLKIMGHDEFLGRDGKYAEI